MIPLFVYGSLLQGMPLFRVIQSAQCLGPAAGKGRLLDLGPYPGLIPGDELILGMLIEVNDSLLEELDRLEDYYPAEPEGSEYHRRPLQVHLLASGTAMTAQAYFYAQETVGYPVISHGDYRRARHCQLQDKRVWVLSYGSNLDPDRLEQRIGRTEQSIPGYIEDFALCFNYIHSDGLARANLVYKPGSRCPAVASLLNPDQAEILDRYEGVAQGWYLRMALYFQTESTNVFWGQAYLARPDHVGSGAQVPGWYLEHIIKGYAYWGWDTAGIPGDKTDGH